MISKNSKFYSKKSDERSRRFHRVVLSRPMLMGAPHNADKRSMREYHYQILTSSHMVSQTILSDKYFLLVNMYDVMAYLLKGSVKIVCIRFHYAAQGRCQGANFNTFINKLVCNLLLTISNFIPIILVLNSR